jgi:hypothetical protein
MLKYNVTSKEGGPKVNAEKAVAVSQPECKENDDVKLAKRSFKNVAHFRCLRMTVTNENLIQDEIRMRPNLDNACSHSVQNLLFSHLLSISIRIRLHKTIVLPMALNGCETWVSDIKGGT